LERGSVLSSRQEKRNKGKVEASEDEQERFVEKENYDFRLVFQRLEIAQHLESPLLKEKEEARKEEIKPIFDTQSEVLSAE